MNGYIIAFSLGALIIGYVFVRIFRAARSYGQSEERAKDADAYEAHLKKIADAADAGNRVRPDDSLHDDPYNRD